MDHLKTVLAFDCVRIAIKDGDGGCLDKVE